MLKKIIYITSNGRSGSTILDNLLGNHTQICTVGELHHLYSYVKQDRKMYNPPMELLCSCGVKVSACPFWKKVESVLDKNLEDIRLQLDLLPYLKEKISLSWLMKEKNIPVKLQLKLISKAIKSYPALLNNNYLFKLSGYHEIALNHFELCNAISTASSKPFVVDASKFPHRFKYIHKLNPDKIIVVHLVRNPAAVANSSIKRKGYSLEESISNWINTEKTINRLLSDLPRKSKIFLKYEDLCFNTKASLKEITDRLDIEFEQTMSTLTLKNKHHLGGSPSKYKYKYNGEISYDDSFRNELSPDQIQYVIKRTMPFIKKYGYYQDLSCLIK